MSIGSVSPATVPVTPGSPPTVAAADSPIHGGAAARTPEGSAAPAARPGAEEPAHEPWMTLGTVVDLYL
ncbi:hypothetical protein [Krasilnikovia sp. MM14-A1259]|uniref:hypothetical protein n=1 Tax=Krasilnikovia sp. MM14-A1259 TaxID=3373539 RepID=UPI00382AA253